MDDLGLGSWQGQDSFFQNIHTKCGAYPAANSVGTGALSSEVKRPRREADHSLSVEVKNKWSYTISPSIRRNGLHRDSFTFTCQLLGWCLKAGHDLFLSNPYISRHLLTF